MKNKKNFKERWNEGLSSWKTLFKFYKKVDLPWHILALVLIFLLLVKEAESALVPYTSKIMTGAITDHGFIGGFIVMTIFYHFIEAIQGGINEFGAVLTTRNVQRTVWKKLIYLPMSTFDSKDKQTLVSRITQDTTGAYAAIACIVQLLAILYALYTNFRKMLKIYKGLAFIMLTFIPLTIIITNICGKMQFKMEKIVIESVSAITNFFAERLPNINHIKVNNMEDEEYRRGIEANNAKYLADKKYWKIFVVQSPLGVMSQYINEVILLLVASALVRAGTMKMSQLVNLYMYFLVFMGNAFMITGIWQNIKKSQGSCSVISKLVEMEDENFVDGSSLNKIEDIRFENVHFRYVENMDVLKGVNFTIPKGKMTAIVGENGSGKSTIIKLLERFNHVSSGNIYLGDQNLYDVNLYEWRNAVGHLFQKDQIIKGSIKDNLCYGLESECSEEEMIQALKLAKAYDFVMDKEEGLDTQISNFSTKLSGGEEQRLAIARILLKNPDYLIMDEATSGIDVVNNEEILDSISEIMKDKTIIIIAHDKEIIKRADHIVVLNDGIIEASGDYDTVLKNSKLMQSFENKEVE